MEGEKNVKQNVKLIRSYASIQNVIIPGSGKKVGETQTGKWCLVSTRETELQNLIYLPNAGALN